MAEDFTASYYNRLTGDPVVLSLISRYSGKPAVFTGLRVPGDASLPWIHTSGEERVGGFTTDFLAGTRQGRDIIVADHVVAGPNLIELLSERVSRLFSWTGTAEVGFEGFQAHASPAIVPRDNIRERSSVIQTRRVEVEMFKSVVSTSSIGFEWYEVPAEVPNGSVTNFSTTRVFLAGSLRVWLNSVMQKPGTDFTADGDLNGYTFTSGAPLTGHHIFHQYLYE